MTKLRRSGCNDRASRLRAQRIRYYRKKIDVPERLSDTLTINRQIQYGRRIAGCVDTLFLRNTVACDDEEDEVRTLSLQGAPKEVRSVLCGGIYHDIDMENCFPNRHFTLRAFNSCTYAERRALRSVALDVSKEVLDFATRAGPHLSTITAMPIKRVPITVTRASPA